MSLTVDLYIENVTDLGAFEFDLNYDPGIVTIDSTTDVDLGSFLGSTGNSAGILGPTIDNGAGVLTVGGFSFGGNPGPNGNGVLVEVTFTVQDLADGSLSLSNVTLTDTSAADITVCGVIDGILLPCYLPYDLDGDGDVDIVDIMMVAAHWGESCD